MRKLLPLLLLIAVLLPSCDLAMAFKGESEAGDIHLVSVAFNYVGSPNVSILNCTLNDQNGYVDQLRHLCGKDGRGFSATVITQGEQGDDHFPSSSKRVSVKTIQKDGGEETRILDSPSELEGEILSALEDARDLPEDDILVFHYSGHGYVYKGDLVIPSSYPEYPLLPLEDLAEALEPISCNKVVILDSCYSGNMVDESQDDPRTDFSEALSGIFGKYEANTSKLYVLAASAAGEPSQEYNYYGEHSRAILDTLGYDLEAFEAGEPEWRKLSVNELARSITSDRYDHSSTQTYTQIPRDLMLFSL